jgi:hypothetical protein
MSEKKLCLTFLDSNASFETTGPICNTTRYHIPVRTISCNAGSNTAEVLREFLRSTRWLKDQSHDSPVSSVIIIRVFFYKGSLQYFHVLRINWTLGIKGDSKSSVLLHTVLERLEEITELYDGLRSARNPRICSQEQEVFLNSDWGNIVHTFLSM